jgi:hypothetical protein
VDKIEQEGCTHVNCMSFREAGQKGSISAAGVGGRRLLFIASLRP